MRLSDEELEALAELVEDELEAAADFAPPTAGWSFTLTPEILAGLDPGVSYIAKLDTRSGEATVTNEATGETRRFPLKAVAFPAWEPKEPDAG